MAVVVLGGSARGRVAGAVASFTIAQESSGIASSTITIIGNFLSYCDYQTRSSYLNLMVRCNNSALHPLIVSVYNFPAHCRTCSYHLSFRSKLHIHVKY